MPSFPFLTLNLPRLAYQEHFPEELLKLVSDLDTAKEDATPIRILLPGHCQDSSLLAKSAYRLVRSLSNMAEQPGIEPGAYRWQPPNICRENTWGL